MAEELKEIKEPTREQSEFASHVLKIASNIDEALEIAEACTVWSSFRDMTGNTDDWQAALSVVMQQKDLKRIKNPGEYSQYDIIVPKRLSNR